MSLVAVESQFDDRSTNPKFVIVLDASGSMITIRRQILEAVNNLIDEQKALSEKLNDGATLTVITFSTENQTIRWNVPFKTARHLELSEYQTDGYTALYDAIGDGILHQDGEKNVVFVIVTDGQENSSKQWNHARVTEAIEAKKAEGWNFIYLANNLDVSGAGASIGISAADLSATTSQTNNIAVGYDNMAATLSRQVSGAFAVYRQSSTVPNLSADQPTLPARSTADHANNPVDQADQLPVMSRGIKSVLQKMDADLDPLTPAVVRTSSDWDGLDDLDFPQQNPKS